MNPSKKMRGAALISLMGLILIQAGCGSPNSASNPNGPAPGSSPFPTFTYSYFFGDSGSVTMDWPYGMGFSSNELWVTNFSNNSLQAWTVAGAPAKSVTSYGSGPTYISEPTGLSVGPDGYIYILDAGNHQAVEFSPTGQYVTIFGNAQMGTDTGTGIAVNASKAYLLDYTVGKVLSFDITGTGSAKTFTPSTTFGNSGITVLSANDWGLALDGSGNVYVADDSNHRLLEYNASGVLQRAVTQGLDAPIVPMVDPAGNIFVSDGADENIHVLNSAGVSIATFGAAYLPGTTFGMALDGSGNLFVANLGQNAVVEFRR